MPHGLETSWVTRAPMLSSQWLPHTGQRNYRTFPLLQKTLWRSACLEPGPCSEGSMETGRFYQCPLPSNNYHRRISGRERGSTAVIA